ncbi:MAG: hypothetical protein WD020_00485 [Acidimicrobiia bacterium]
MPSTQHFRPDARHIADEDGETFESIPWEALDRLGRSGDHRRWYVIAGVIVAFAVAFSAIRSLGTSDPVEIVDAPTVPVSVTAPVTTTSTLPEVITEADLMAIDVHMLERAAAGLAEAAAVEYFSAESHGIWTGVEFDPSRSTFVESATAVTVTQVAATRFEVIVAVSVLDAVDAVDGSPFVRRPLRGVSIVVDGADGTFRPLDLPTPATLPFGSLIPAAATEEIADPAAIETATALAASFGTVVADSVVVATLASGEQRVALTMVDEAGIAWPMSFPLGEP